jgi:hypothetical protein
MDSAQGHDVPRLDALRARVELFAKRHDVHTLLTQRRPHGRSRIGRTSGNL